MRACAARYETGAPRARIARSSEPFDHTHSCCTCSRPLGGGGWIRLLSAGRGDGAPGNRRVGQRPFTLAAQRPVLAFALAVAEPALAGGVHRPAPRLGRRFEIL